MKSNGTPIYLAQQAIIKMLKFSRILQIIAVILNKYGGEPN